MTKTLVFTDMGGITEHALSHLPEKCDTVFYLDETRTITKQDVKR